MSLMNAFKASGSALSAQSHRLNTVASNMANVDTVTGEKAEAYQAKKVVFQAVLDKTQGGINSAKASTSVKIKDVIESDAEIKEIYDPEHPLANADGYVYASNVNPAEEMVEMIAASRSYQSSAEIMNTAKNLMLKTINLGS